MVAKKMYFERTEETCPVLAHDILNYHPYYLFISFFSINFAPQKLKPYNDKKTKIYIHRSFRWMRRFV